MLCYAMLCYAMLCYAMQIAVLEHMFSSKPQQFNVYDDHLALVDPLRDMSQIPLLLMASMAWVQPHAYP